MSIWKFVTDIFGPAAQIVDALHTSAEEKLKIKVELSRIQAEVSTKALDYERALLEAQASVITHEAKSESRLARTWRPVTMLAFLGIVVWYVVATTFGWRVPPEPIVLEIFGLIKLGLGGYVVGRSAEKVVPAVIEAFKRRDNP